MCPHAAKTNPAGRRWVAGHGEDEVPTEKGTSVHAWTTRPKQNSLVCASTSPVATEVAVLRAPRAARKCARPGRSGAGAHFRPARARTATSSSEGEWTPGGAVTSGARVVCARAWSLPGWPPQLPPRDLDPGPRVVDSAEWRAHWPQAIAVTICGAPPHAPRPPGTVKSTLPMGNGGSEKSRVRGPAASEGERRPSARHAALLPGSPRSGLSPRAQAPSWEERGHLCPFRLRRLWQRERGTCAQSWLAALWASSVTAASAQTARVGLSAPFLS